MLVLPQVQRFMPRVVLNFFIFFGQKLQLINYESFFVAKLNSPKTQLSENIWFELLHQNGEAGATLFLRALSFPTQLYFHISDLNSFFFYSPFFSLGLKRSSTLLLLLLSWRWPREEKHFKMRRKHED